MCRVAYWLQTPEIIDACADLIFEFQSVGTGSKQATFTLQLLGDEETHKESGGISGWRRLLIFVGIADSLPGEGESESEAARLHTLINDENVDVGTINIDTMKRYLAIGRRMQKPELQRILTKREAVPKRDCVVDQLTTLRSVFQATDNDTELCHIIHVLMMQQRSGIRCELKSRRVRSEPHPTLRRAS